LCKCLHSPRVRVLIGGISAPEVHGPPNWQGLYASEQLELGHKGHASHCKLLVLLLLLLLKHRRLSPGLLLLLLLLLVKHGRLSNSLQRLEGLLPLLLLLGLVLALKCRWQHWRPKQSCQRRYWSS